MNYTQAKKNSPLAKSLQYIVLILLEKWFFLSFNGKLHFTTLNYIPDYTLRSKPCECTFYILNNHTYHILHPNVTFAVMFDGILLHVTSTCFLLRWNKVKKLKHPSSKSIKTKANFFHWSARSSSFLIYKEFVMEITI